MSTAENDKLARAYADLRADIARSGPGLVKVFRDQLELVLDAVAPLKASQKVLGQDPVGTKIKRGDTIELVIELRYFGTVYPSGTKGTVSYVYANDSSFPYVVQIVGSDLDIEINFNRNEIRKAA